MEFQKVFPNLKVHSRLKHTLRSRKKNPKQAFQNSFPDLEIHLAHTSFIVNTTPYMYFLREINSEHILTIFNTKKEVFSKM